QHATQTPCPRADSSPLVLSGAALVLWEEPLDAALISFGIIREEVAIEAGNDSDALIGEHLCRPAMSPPGSGFLKILRVFLGHNLTGAAGEQWNILFRACAGISQKVQA